MPYRPQVAATPTRCCNGPPAEYFVSPTHLMPAGFSRSASLRANHRAKSGSLKIRSSRLRRSPSAKSSSSFPSARNTCPEWMTHLSRHDHKNSLRNNAPLTPRSAAKGSSGRSGRTGPAMRLQAVSKAIVRRRGRAGALARVSGANLESLRWPPGNVAPCHRVDSGSSRSTFSIEIERRPVAAGVFVCAWRARRIRSTTRRRALCQSIAGFDP